MLPLLLVEVMHSQQSLIEASLWLHLSEISQTHQAVCWQIKSFISFSLHLFGTVLTTFGVEGGDDFSAKICRSFFIPTLAKLPSSHQLLATNFYSGSGILIGTTNATWLWQLNWQLHWVLLLPLQVQSTTPTFCVATAGSCPKSRNTSTTFASLSPSLSGTCFTPSLAAALLVPGM